MSTAAFARRPHPRRRVVLQVAAAAIASLAVAATVIGSFGHRSSTTDRVPVAVVNLDEPTTSSDGSTIAAGRQLAGQLVAPQTATALAWSVTDRTSAENGLADGTFDAVVTIPADFSAVVTSLSGDAPRTAEVGLETNDATSPVASAVSEQVVGATAAAFGTDVTVHYLDTTYQSIDRIGQGLSDAASGANDLSDGADRLASSADDLAGGADTLASSAGRLADGTTDLAGAADGLASGAASASAGAGDLAAGAQDVASGAASLSDGAATLASGTAKVADGASALAGGAAQSSSAVGSLSTSSQALAAGVHEVASGAAGLATACPPTAGQAYCAQVASLAASATDAADGADAMSAGLSSAASGVAEVSASAASLAAGAADTQAGAADTQAGAARLVSAADQTSQGATSLAAGMGEVSSAAAQVAGAAGQVDSGASSLASAASDLATGAQGVSDGARSVADSATTLASSLTDAAASVPDYSDESARSTLAGTVATPVAVSTSVINPATSERPAAAAVAAVVALWLGTVVLGLVRPAVPRWALAAPATGFRATLLGLAPHAMLAVIEAVALCALAPLAGIDPASTIRFGVLALVGGLVLGAVQQATLVLAPRRGQVIALLFGLLQVVSLMVPFPAQMAPAVFQWLAGALPMPVIAHGLNQAVLGGSVGSDGSVALTLAIWAAAAIVATTAATRRRLTAPRRPVAGTLAAAEVAAL